MYIDIIKIIFESLSLKSSEYIECVKHIV